MTAGLPSIETIFDRMRTAPNQVVEHLPGPNPQVRLDRRRATVNGTQDPLILARFWSKVDVRQRSKCWLWRAAVNADGYGQFWDGSRLVRAHRFALEAAGGDLSSAVADHECHNASGCTDAPCVHRRCCNPAHLRAVSQGTNSRRGRTGRHNAEKSHCRNGHEYTQENTVYPLRPGGGRDERVCKKCRQISQDKYKEARRGK